MLASNDVKSQTDDRALLALLLALTGPLATAATEVAATAEAAALVSSAIAEAAGMLCHIISSLSLNTNKNI